MSPVQREDSLISAHLPHSLWASIPCSNTLSHLNDSVSRQKRSLDARVQKEKQFIRSPLAPPVLALAAAIEDRRRLIGTSNLDFREEGLIMSALLALHRRLILEVHCVIAHDERFHVELCQLRLPPLLLLEVHFQVAAAALELNRRRCSVNQQQVPARRAEVVA